MSPEDEQLPTYLPMGEDALLALLREAEGVERPLDDRMVLGRVELTPETLRRMTRKAKVNKRFKRNRDKPVGRPKSHYKTKQKLKKANNRRNYLKRTKPKLEALKLKHSTDISPSLPFEGEEGI